MVRDDPQLSAAKRAYKNAAAEGNRQEEARWANMIGDILKNKGEYVEALKWLRIDYDISVKCLPEKHLLPTCQSLGEVYLRLNHFGDALIYQKKHLELAKDSSDLIEQQRASTQLGRTYHEMFLKSEDDHYAVRNAKKYFKSAMKLALMLKENPPSNKSSFLEEFIDAHNNIGMLEMDLDNLEEAHKILTKGLEICDEEEVTEDDAKRSRLHHNLGSVYTELRMWDKAREHIEKDIIICKRIGHCQGEAKGYINLGELHYKVQKYEEALLCYQKALDLARSMEDEDALADQIDQNIDVVKEAIKVMGEMKKEEQNLKKLTRNMVTARGTPGERKCLLQQSASLDRLIEKSSMISAWKKHCEFAKRKKRIAKELCDKEKESDSFLVIGESYQKLRIFSKALKWYKKSWEIYKSIGNLEGQALVKVNIGDVLDCDGDWVGALDAFEEGYRIAVEANLPSVQLSALENMHYSNMIRFDNVDEARRLQLLIDNLKQSKNRELEAPNLLADCCSETDTEGDSHISNSRSNVHSSPKMSKSNSSKTNSFTSIEELRDDAPLISFIQPSRNLPKPKTVHVAKNITSTKPSHASPKSLSKSIGSQQTAVGRKRVRVVLLSDDEDEMHDEAERSRGRLHNGPVEDVATSDERRGKNDPASRACDFKEVSPVGSKCAISSCTPVNLEESTSSYKSRGPTIAAHVGKDFRSSSTDDVAIASSSDQCMTFKIDNDLIHVEAESREAESWMVGDSLNIESMKVEVACLYYLQLPMEKRSKGLLPIIQHMTCGGRPLESLEGIEMLKDYVGRGWIEVYVDGWVQKRLMKLYVDCCKELSETPNMKLLKKLYNLEVSEDEILVSECDLQDLSITPLLNALQTHKTVALLDLSHNLLGNGTMEKLQEVFISSGQKYGGLVLDLHSNRFGPTALFQICECPVLFARLEVLNISWNRLTDACGSCLSTILENCKALYSLNIESCSITSRTIQKIADSLNDGSALSQFSFGYNNSISGNAIINLLAKLSTLKRFSELNMSGLKLNKPVVDSLCQLAKASCLSGLLLGGTNIGIHGALQLFESLFTGTQEIVKLDLSHCGLTSQFITRLDTDVTLISTLLELNLGGNPIKQEGCNALASLLVNPQCYLKTLTLNKCQLGLSGVIQIVQALASNESLEELNLAQNADLTLSAISPCGVNTGCNQLQVADSEEDDDSIRAEPVYDMSSGCRFIQEISIGIGAAKWLKLLDLSGNGFSTQIVEMFYTAWCSRGGLCQRHVKEQMVHFSVEGVKCCGVKPCCRRDLNL